MKEKIHRLFIQESGLEMLGKLEKEENDKEKARNFEEFKKIQGEIDRKTEEIHKKMLGFFIKFKKNH